MRILVAESQKVVRRVIVSCLEKFPASVLKASDQNGLEILLQQQADLLILDTSMLPNGVGVFLETIHRRYPSLPVILTTYRDGAPEIAKLQTTNIFPLTKPFTERDLEGALEQALSAGTVDAKPAEEPSRFLEIESLPSIGRHPVMNKAVAFLRNVADSDLTVLIYGESGVGKESFARRLHMLSRRINNRFVGINCASIPSSLLEGELFGSERGAFTGALTRRIGKFELAQKGTLLLDEVSEMDVSLQSKLLRVIQEKELYRIGGTERVHLDVRLVATTNCDLKEQVRQKKFREDLYYRLNVISIRIPPLRERTEDIPVLAQYLLDRFHDENPDRPSTLTPSAIDQLCRYPWPGNIRELENILMRTIFLTPGPAIDKVYFDEEDAPDSLDKTAAFEGGFSAASSIPLGSIRDVERQMICRALEIHKGNRVRAASLLGISVRTLRNKLRLYREEGLLPASELTDISDLGETEDSLDEAEESTGGPRRLLS